MNKVLIPASLVLVLMGCTSGPKVYNSTQPGGGDSNEQTPDNPRSITVELEADDIIATVQKMVQSMLDDREFIEEIGGKRPVLDIGKLDTSRINMRLDHKLITDSMRTKLQRSRKFRFVDGSTSDQDLMFMNNQAQNGMTDPSKAVQIGKQSAAQMFLYGSISEMRHTSQGIIDQYYKITLNLKDLRSGEIVWTDEQPVKKREIK